MQHGPLFVIAGVLILAGIQMLAIGLLGELQVRHYYTSAAARALRDRSPGAACALRKSRACLSTERTGSKRINLRFNNAPPRCSSRRGLLFLNASYLHALCGDSIITLALQLPALRVHSCACMNAIQIQATGGPEVLQLAELPIPAPGPGQVLIRVEAIGVNFIEIYFRKGTYKATLPLIPGSEAAGTVEELARA